MSGDFSVFKNRDQLDSMAPELARFLDGLQRLVFANFRLARAQITQEAQSVGRGAVWMACGLVPVILGYGFCMAALFMWMTGFLGKMGALLFLGVLNIGWGMALFVRGRRRGVRRSDAREPNQNGSG